MSTSTVSAWPDGIGPEHVEEAPAWRRHASPLSLVVFGAVVALALLGLLGHEGQWVATDNGTTLSVHMPETIRNGEFLELRIGVQAEEAIGQLVIGVEASLWQDVTINTMIPAASEEASADGEYRFTFGALEAGTAFLLKVDGQINPDMLGGNAGAVTVFDGDEPLVSTDLRMTVLP